MSLRNKSNMVLLGKERSRLMQTAKHKLYYNIMITVMHFKIDKS